MTEPTTQNVIHDLARAKASLQACEAHGTRLMQLEADVERAKQTLAGLQAQAAQVQPMVAQIEDLDQRIRQKKLELANLEQAIAKGNEQHGAVVSKLRDLRKQISGDPQHA